MNLVPLNAHSPLPEQLVKQADISYLLVNKLVISCTDSSEFIFRSVRALANAPGFIVVVLVVDVVEVVVVEVVVVFVDVVLVEVVLVEVVLVVVVVVLVVEVVVVALKFNFIRI